MRLPRELSSALLHRAHRASLHRLRGVIQILGGWATLGTPEPADEKIRVRLQEAQILSDRMNLLWQLQLEQNPDLTDPNIAPAILAGAMRAGTPEEAGSRLPITQSHPIAFMALSAWLESTIGECAFPKIQLSLEDSELVRARVNGQPLSTPDSWLWEQFSSYLRPEKIDSTEMGNGAGVFVSGLSMLTEDQDQASPALTDQTEKDQIED